MICDFQVKARAFENSERFQDYDVLASRGFRRDFSCDLSKWSRIFPGKHTPRLADFLRIACAIYFADRIVKRSNRCPTSGWIRAFNVSIGVCDYDFWSDQSVTSDLTSCISFLTGDSWSFTFSPTHTDDIQQLLPINSAWRKYHHSPVICLYSGGLDSAAGLVKRIIDQPDGHFIPILVRHKPSLSRIVNDQLVTIGERFNRPLSLLTLPFRMRTPTQISGQEESTQRSRSFLFCTVAAIAASFTNGESVELLEGGVGAFNAPLMSSMLGSKATRSCHPTFVSRFERLAKRVLNSPIRFRLPHLFVTKGELASVLADAGLGGLTASTMSCTAFPMRDSEFKQCGKCPACIFRRHAILVAELSNFDCSYRHDLFGDAINVNKVTDDHLWNLKAFLLQIHKLDAIESSDSLPPFLARHFKATGIELSIHEQAKVVDLYRRYRREWTTLIQLGVERGWSWTNLLEYSSGAMEEIQHA